MASLQRRVSGEGIRGKSTLEVHVGGCCAHRTCKGIQEGVGRALTVSISWCLLAHLIYVKLSFVYVVASYHVGQENRLTNTN